MPAISRIQLYILRECLSGLAIVIGILFFAILLIDVVEQLRTVGGDVNLSMVGAIRLSLMKLPQLIEQTLPFSLLVAAMMAYTRLNRRSELAIIRASGISAWRFLAPIIFLGVLLGLFSTLVLNPFSSRLSGNYERARSALLQTGREAAAVSGEGVWLRQGDDTSQFVIYAKRFEQGGMKLIDVKMIEEQRLYLNGKRTDDFAFVRQIDANEAMLRDGFWQLEGVVENVPSFEPHKQESLAIPTSLDAITLLDKFASPNTVDFWSLPQFIRQTRDAGLDASRYRIRFWSLMASPVLFVAMSLIGAVVCLQLQRGGGTSRLLAIGTLTSIGLYFFTQFASSLGATGAAPPFVAAWSPPLFFLFGTLAYIAWKEDG